MCKKKLALFLVVLIVLSVLPYAGLAQGVALAAPASSPAAQLQLSTNVVSMTEAREIEVTADLGYVPKISDLKWTYGGKEFSEWKKWNPDEKQFSGAPIISFAAEPTLVGSTVKAVIKFDLPFDTTDLSSTKGGSSSIRRVYPQLIGTFDLTVTDTSSGVSAKSPVQLKPYDSYLTYDELLRAIDELKGAVPADRYLDVQVIGKTVEGRDMQFAVLAKNKAAVDEYLNKTLPLMLNDPAVLQKKLAKGQLGDYKVPLFFNNIHPDEAPGPDAIFELLKILALQDTITYPTIDEQGKDTTITIDVDEALNHIIFLFNFTENPDGRVHNTRRNANDFDVNRDNGFQTQPESQAVTAQIAKWTPLVFLDFHGFHDEYLIEPCTPPHDPNYEYDLLAENMLKLAHRMGDAAIVNTKYDRYFIPLEGFADPAKNFKKTGERYVGWDDAAPNYTATYAMHHGALGHTIEIPDINEDSTKALIYNGLAATKFVLDEKDQLFKNQLEYFKRGVNGEDNPAVDQWLVDPQNKVIGRPRVNGQNFFPEYYVLPVDGGLQKNALETYHMVEYLLRNGVKVEESTKPVTVNGVTYPAGTFVVPMHQAKRGYANTVLADGVDVSAWSDMYAEIVMNFPDLRGFDTYEIRTPGVFAGKTKPVVKVSIPATKVNGKAAEYIIKSTNNDAVKAVNELLAAGKSVKLVEQSGGNFEMGDYLVTAADLQSIKDKYFLDVVPVEEAVSAKPLSYPKVANVGSLSTAYVLKQLGFKLVDDVASADVIVDDSGQAAPEDILAGKPYIGIGGNALKLIKEKNILPGFDFGQDNNTYEGLFRANLAQNSVITAPLAAESTLYSASGSWITAVPAGAKILARISGEENFFKAGWWPGHEKVKGQVFAFNFDEGNKHITLFANSITNRAHPAAQFRLLANAIYANVTNAAKFMETGLAGGKTFTDITGHWAEKEIQALAASGFLHGVDANHFAPEQKLTRAELAAIIYRLLQALGQL